MIGAGSTSTLDTRESLRRKGAEAFATWIFDWNKEKQLWECAIGADTDGVVRLTRESMDHMIHEAYK